MEVVISFLMQRERMMKNLADDRTFDVLIVGGGATGLGCAVDAAARGYDTCLVEQADFAKGTSSRSTKLVHGGVRYLAQGNVALVLDALAERGLLRDNAPHLVHAMPFVIPTYSHWSSLYYGLGLRTYDFLAGRASFGRSSNLSRQATLDAIPTLEPDRLHGGVRYHDGQFDDARLAINLAQTAAEHGATLLNYMKVSKLIHESDRVAGAVADDIETGQQHRIRARVVINATGVFTDAVRSLDDSAARPMIRPSQGAHIVLPRRFLPGDSAIMIPKTEDNRVLFAIPWHEVVIVGTTDTPVGETPLEPRAMDAELEFLLSHAAKYLAIDPTPDDVLSVFVGLRPLVAEPGGEGKTSKISRDHTIHTSPRGLISVAGGKWTTYRKMAEDAINHAVRQATLTPRACPTRTLPIHGHHTEASQFNELAHYGSDAPAIRELIEAEPEHRTKLHPDLPYHAGEVVWHARHEMARTVDDVLARRTRAVILNARAAINAAPHVAALLARELDRDERWQQQQVEAFNDMAQAYLYPRSR